MADKPVNPPPQAAQQRDAVNAPAPASQTKAPEDATAKKVTKGLTEDELGAALDSLLSEAKDAKASPVTPTPPVSPAAAAVAHHSTQDGAAHDKNAKAHAEALTTAEQGVDGKSDADPDAVEGDIVGDDLANEIQNLLDTAAAASTPPKATATPVTESVATSKTPASTGAATPPAVSAKPAAPAAPASAPPAAEKPILEVDGGITGDPLSVEEMDAMLAKEAEEAVSQKFETTESVAATPADTDTAAAAPSALAEAPADGTATSAGAVAQNVDNSVVEDDDAVPGQFEAPEEATQEVASTDAADGSVNSQPVEKVEPETPAAKEAPALTPGAAAVAKELDEQPETIKAAATAASPAPAATPSAAEAAPATKKPAVTKPPEPAPPEKPRAPRISLLKRLCMAINAPLVHATPQVRDAVGWVALLTVFNAAALIGWSMASKASGAQESGEHAAIAGHDEHGAAPAHGETKNSHGEASKSHGDAGKSHGSDGHGGAKKPEAKPQAKKPADKGHGASEKAKKPDAHGGH